MKYTKTKQRPWYPLIRGNLAGLVYPVLGQVKFDGEYCVLSGGAALSKGGISRSSFPDLDHIIRLGQNAKLEGMVFMAELYWNEGKLGSLGGLLKNYDSDLVKIYIHDVLIWDTPTWGRMALLERIFGVPFGEVLSDRAQVDAFLKASLVLGYEGVVLKSLNGTLAQAGQWVKLKKEVGDGPPDGL